MEQKLVRVREFAQACGCTPQNIYGHLKTYAADLEGHTFQGRGRQGVLLDDFAQDFLRSVMYPKEIGDNALAEEIAKLKNALFQAGVQTAELMSKLAAAEGERDHALLEAKENKKLLKASQEAEEARAAELKEKDEQLQAKDEQLQEKTEQLQKAEERHDRLMSRGLIARIRNLEVD